MPIGDLLASITGEPSPTFPPGNSNSTLPPKRKASDDLRRPVDKVQKLNSPAANSSRPITSTRPSTLDTTAGKSKALDHCPKALPSNGRRPSDQAPAVKKSASPVSTGPPKAPPKKGSFAEIMARAKVAQANLGQVGKIQHKKIEKRPSKREIEESKAQQSKNLKKGIERAGLNGKPVKPGQAPSRAGKDGRNGTKENGKSAPAEQEKKVKKAAIATTGYAGTARPRPGSSKSSKPIPRRDEPKRYGNGGGYGGSSRRYTYASEEEDDDMEQEDYESDVSSDMEAAAFEVDDEEEEAARIARREDAEALAEENRLKREKEEKKRRLMALAKKARR